MTENLCMVQRKFPFFPFFPWDITKNCNYSANNFKECPFGQKSNKSIQNLSNLYNFFCVDLFDLLRFEKFLAAGDSKRRFAE